MAGQRESELEPEHSKDIRWNKGRMTQNSGRYTQRNQNKDGCNQRKEIDLAMGKERRSTYTIIWPTRRYGDHSTRKELLR